MATRSFEKTLVQNKVHRFVWTGLLNGDDGESASVPLAADMTFQVIQVAVGSGDTIILEGSCEETAGTYFQMRDMGDNVISFTGSDGEGVAPIAAFIRPRVTAGDGTTNFTAILFARSTMR